jgi:hypothetical protein
MFAVDAFLKRGLGAAHKTTRTAARALRAFGNMNVERKAKELLHRVESSSLSIDESDGYAKFAVGDIGLEKPVSKLREQAFNWKNDPMRNRGDKPFLVNLLKDRDILEMPEVMDVAMHPILYGAVAKYLKQVPWLVSMTVWLSPPNQTAVRSQLYHYDHKDTRQAKIFINLNDVTSDSGPLHFLPARRSVKVNNKVGYSQGRYSDEEVYGAVSKDDAVAAVGDAGSGYIVDTARCLHYGSRGNTKERLILMINYARVNCVEPGSGCECLDPVRDQLIAQRYANDEARAFSLKPR